MPEIMSMRATDGLVSRPAIAADIGVTPRTIVRYEHAGMPVLRVGKLRFYDLQKVRAWLLSHEPVEPKRGPGRPRKNAA